MRRAVEYVYEKFEIDAPVGAVGYSASCNRYAQNFKEKKTETIKRQHVRKHGVVFTPIRKRLEIVEIVSKFLEEAERWSDAQQFP